MAHAGEEPPVSGTRGSGVIFFSHCTLACAYCQNYKFSQNRQGIERSALELSDMMMELVAAGCHNVNLVSATHYLPAALEALSIAIPRGLRAPIVWNTSGYESQKTLELLEGIVDVYLADLRYSSNAIAGRLSDAPDYVDVNRRALAEMDRQVGPLTTDDDGLAVRGLIVRHLVLPGALSGTPDAMDFIARELSSGTFVSLMAQYYPAHRAHGFPKLARRVSRAEFDQARAALSQAGIVNGWVQELPVDGELPTIAGSRLDPDGAGG
jgi:putative pyruvate formate lyase activating enzyme